MRKVILYELISLDGVADEPGESQWFGDANHRLMENLAEVTKTQDAVLLGRQTFDKWAPFWPTSSFQPFADFINNTPKFVFSSKPLDRTWSETTHVAEAASAFVDRLRRADGADIGIHGSLTLARSLLRDHLIDELRLVVAPSLAGEGRRLFDGSSGLQKFELVKSDRSAGCLLLHYRTRATS